ncbi:MAG: hypothetical protein KatS3mg089_0320 [Patescibacteria group bacterium]|nr:MAG: hypothetical protein KatS3mg089_0320 [Patescibacteria group bacterium]
MRSPAYLYLAIVLLLLIVGKSFAFVKLSQVTTLPSLSPTNWQQTFRLPDTAVKIADDLYKIPKAKDPVSGLDVEGYAIIHKKAKFKQAFLHKSKLTNSKTSCYGFFAKGAKWKNVEPWLLNATGSGLLDNFVLSNLSQDISKWEDATDGVLGNGGLNVLGDGSLTTNVLVADTTAPDGLNEVYFGPIDDPNTIAVTIVWGYFSGLVSKRRIVEWDQIYNTAYQWSASGEAGKMDFENIATHELGHSVGLIDLYNSSCTDETMYGYATEGETKKRDLNTGDITGMNKLY